MATLAAFQQPVLSFGLTIAAATVFSTLSRPAGQPENQSHSPLVVRVAVFAADQLRPDLYRDFVESHLFPTLRSSPGYAGVFLGRDPHSGQLISLSFWRSEADAVAAEEAVGRTVRALPPGSAPRPSQVLKYVVEFRDVPGSFAK
jgi:hypothetical protein